MKHGKRLLMDFALAAVTRHTQKQLGIILQNCVSCHSMFQIHAMAEKLK